MKPLILINFKNYPEAIGSKALPLLKDISAVKTNKYQIAVAPSTLDLKECIELKRKRKFKVQIFSQHADPKPLGAYTGSIPVTEIAKLKADGTLLNHSEFKIPFQQIGLTIKECAKKGLTSIVCASSLREVKKIVKFKPDYIAYEPSELIGGNKSVTKAKPDVILKAVEIVNKHTRKTKVLCGAGIHTREDIGQSSLLGCAGVLIGHAVPKARNPQKFLEGLL